MRKALLVASLLIGLAAVRPDPAFAQRAPHVGGTKNVHAATMNGGSRRVMLQFGWPGGWGWGARPAWGWGGWGWRGPLAAGVAIGSLGYYSSPYNSYADYPYYSDPYYSSYPYYSNASYDSCAAWNGYQWVNVCYQPYGYYGY